MAEVSGSLFLGVYCYTRQQVISILQLKTPEEQEVKTSNMDDLEVLRFIPPNRMIRWYVSATISSTDDLYILPSCPLQPPLHGYKFNFMTASLQKLKPPLAHKSQWDGFVVNLGRHIYFMGAIDNDMNNIDFECYNPDQHSWKALKPFPNDPCGSRIVAIAVCDDTILFNADFCAIWAYNVSINEWYPVHVDDVPCYSFEGNAVVVQDTIYALANRNDFPFNRVLALSFIKTYGSNGDLIYKCKLLSEISVSGLDPILDDDLRAWTSTRDLVHLGKLNFCLVQTSMSEGLRRYLYIQLTYMELNGKKLVIVMERYRKLKIHDREHFEVVQCFFLPESKATALGAGKRLDFKFDSHEVHSVYVRNLPRYSTVEQIEKGLNVFGPIVRDGIQVQSKKGKCSAFVEFEGDASVQRAIEAKIVSIGGCRAEIYDKKKKRTMKKNHPHSSHDEVHSVYVRNLPRHATVEQVEKGLNVFGPIVRDGVLVRSKKKTKVFAFVEFEAAASKQHAIEAKTVYIGDCQAEIYDRKWKRKWNQSHSSFSGLQKDGQAQ